MIQLLKPLLEPQWHPIDLGDDQSFEVLIRPAKFGDLVADEVAIMSELLGQRPAGESEIDRLKRFIVGWRGVQTEPDADGRSPDVPYSFEAFVSLCECYPPVLLRVVTLCRQAALGHRVKNSEGPSAAGSTAAPSTENPSADSDSGNSTEPPSVSAEPTST